MEGTVRLGAATKCGCLRVVNQEGSATNLPADAFRSGETSLDVQEAHAIYQNCRIVVVKGNPQGSDLIKELGVGVNTAVGDGATEISICIELYADSTEAAEAAYLVKVNDEYFNHPGVVITVASGDCGYDETNDPLCLGPTSATTSPRLTTSVCSGRSGSGLGPAGTQARTAVGASGGGGRGGVPAFGCWDPAGRRDLAASVEHLPARAGLRVR
jgi:hypothetical protein